LSGGIIWPAGRANVWWAVGFERLEGEQPTKPAPRKNQEARRGAELPGVAFYVPPTDKRTSNVRGSA
jgi:hypothetical protein